MQRANSLVSEVAQSYPTLCDPMDCCLPGSSVHGILQARILEWVAISFSRGSSRPRDRTWVSRISGRRFNLWATREAEKTPTLGKTEGKKRRGWQMRRSLVITNAMDLPEGQASLVCCSTWNCKKLDLTWCLNNNNN